MTLAETLTALSGYPIPRPLVLNVLEAQGLSADATATTQTRQTKAYKSAVIAIYRFLATAPNVSQGGISYSLTADDKAEFKRMANEMSDELDEGKGVIYGYQGDSF